MNTYCESIDGSFIEDHESMIIWNFVLVEPEYGYCSAKQLRIDLQDALKYFNIEVFIGKGYVEVKNKNVKKEILVKKILEGFSEKADIDFCLYVGEDRYRLVH